MWKITTHGFTLQQVLIMVAMNVAHALIATDKGERNDRAQPTAPTFTRIQEIVMAKTIEFYIPKNFRNPLTTTAQPQLGKIIEFCPQTKRSA
jgi:hypothetical protein